MAKTATECPFYVAAQEIGYGDAALKMIRDYQTFQNLNLPSNVYLFTGSTNCLDRLPVGKYVDISLDMTKNVWSSPLGHQVWSAAELAKTLQYSTDGTKFSSPVDPWSLLHIKIVNIPEEFKKLVNKKGFMPIEYFNPPFFRSTQSAQQWLSKPQNLADLKHIAQSIRQS